MNFRKILVIQTAFIGDVILSSGFIRELHKGFPEAEIDLVTTPVSRVLFKHNPYLRNVYSFAKQGFKGLINQVKLGLALRKRKYDAAFSLHLSPRSSILMIQAGIPVRIGHPRMWFLTHPVAVKPGLHMKDRYIGILKPFIKFEPDPSTELHLGENDLQYAESLMREGIEFQIGIAPGSIRTTKRWPKEYFITLLRKLSGQVQIFFIGSSEDQTLCQEIITSSGVEAINLAGKLDLLGSAAIIDKLDLLVSNDSAPLHMANAVKTNVFGIFGPTVKAFGCFPYRSNDYVFEVDLACRPCSKHGGKKCPERHFKCMLDTTPDLVWQKIREDKDRWEKNHVK